MSTVQQQAQDLAGAYPVCGQASVPRIGRDEYRRSHVYQSFWRVSAVRKIKAQVEWTETKGLLYNLRLFSSFLRLDQNIYLLSSQSP